MRNVVEEIKSRLDIVEVLKEYMQLKQAGTSWKGLCPFHNEKTPSFMVSQDKQVWHCFGCSQGGDVFTFIEQVENVDFREALKILAHRANVQLPEYNAEEASERGKMLELHVQAMKFFQQQLFTERGEAARDYLKSRGLDKQAVLDWQIGYAPKEWDALMNAMQNKGFTKELLLSAGLLVENHERGSSYDRFRDRIMFPIRDHNGQVIAFTGRQLDAEAQGGKYVNSPQTMLYDKSAVLFGLDKARLGIKEHGFVILAEGQMDVISSSVAGVTQVIAASGTALTEAQLDLLKRYTKKIAVAFDQDSAGVKALERSIMLALSVDCSVDVIKLPEGEDPDSLIQKDVERWKLLVEGRVGFMEYYFDRAQQLFDVTTIDGRKQITKKLLPVIASIADRVEQDLYMQRLSGLVQVSPNVLYEALPRDTQKRPTEEQKPAEAKAVGSGLGKRHQRLLACLLVKPQEFVHIEDKLPQEYWQDEVLKELYIQAILFYTKHNNNSDNSVSESIDAFEKSLTASKDSRLVDFLNALKLLGEDMIAAEVNVQREIEQLVRMIKRDFLQKRIAEVQLRLSQNDQDDSLLPQLDSLLKKLKEL